MTTRTVEDHLREEYFDLVPDMRRVVEHLEAVIRYDLLGISNKLDRFEQVVVKSRVKECESAIEALRRPEQEGATFDRDSRAYTLRSLKDLAGVCVLAFPRNRLDEIDETLRTRFPEWTEDPIFAEDGERLAFKYWVRSPASDQVTGEYQIVSTLTGLFWEVEHSAVYKPSSRLRGVARSPEMNRPISAVVKALGRFEEEFERLVQEAK